MLIIYGGRNDNTYNVRFENSGVFSDVHILNLSKLTWFK